MPKVVGIQFKGGGRIYFFDPLRYNFEPNEYAIVETVRGLELGRVVLGNHEVDASKIESELKPIIRKADPSDVVIDEENSKLADEAFLIFKKAVSDLNLDMKPLYAEYTIDRSKLVFYYTADDRVDFRELLKVLTPSLKIRVELRQIGAREAARYLGGLGSCGLAICCSKNMRQAEFVTMKMAKDQSLSLNLNKISGTCGKLMCCISYESEMYQELKKLIPGVGTFVKTPNGVVAKVIAVDYIKKTVRLYENPDSLVSTYLASDVTIVNKGKENERDSK